MKRNEYISLIIITISLVLISGACLFITTTLDDAGESSDAIAKQSEIIINKIQSGEIEYTEQEAIKLFSNKSNESISTQSLMNGYAEMIREFAYIIIVLAMLQGFIVANCYFKRKN